MLRQVATNQVGHYRGAQQEESDTSKICEFLKINPLEFNGFKVEEDPNWFIDEVYKTLAIMELTSKEKAKLAFYQSKYVSQVWYEQWKNSRPARAGPIEWETFKSSFHDIFFSTELKDAKLGEFINLK